MSNLDLDTHSINIKCPKCSRIVAESIQKLKSDLTTFCITCNEHFKISEVELNQGIERIEANIHNMKESLRKA